MEGRQRGRRHRPGPHRRGYPLCCACCGGQRRRSSRCCGSCSPARRQSLCCACRQAEQKVSRDTRERPAPCSPLRTNVLQVSLFALSIAAVTLSVPSCCTALEVKDCTLVTFARSSLSLSPCPARNLSLIPPTRSSSLTFAPSCSRVCVCVQFVQPHRTASLRGAGGRRADARQSQGARRRREGYLGPRNGSPAWQG